MTTPDEGRGRCADCVHFRNDPAFLERSFAGLSSLSSGWAAVRAEDGLCLWHDRYLGADGWCRDFAARAAAPRRGLNSAPI